MLYFSVCSNTDDSLTLINNAVQSVLSCDALGILLCDWTLPGHVNPIQLSIPAFLATAGLSWKADTELVSWFFSSLCFVDLFLLFTLVCVCLFFPMPLNRLNITCVAGGLRIPPREHKYLCFLDTTGNSILYISFSL